MPFTLPDPEARSPRALFLDRLTTPLGVALLVWDDVGRVRALDWHDHEARLRRLLHRHYGAAAMEPTPSPAPPALARALDAYFAGELDALAALPRATGGTPFQRRVWAALGEIPAGATESYGTLAARIGAPRAVRAVGLANGQNPLSLVVPCHRVIGADGSLTGYGGGLARKRWLLDHEGARLAPTHAVQTAERGYPLSPCPDQP
jgi:methylated-DNA-[protein]-cysteine S-methyltransferase